MPSSPRTPRHSRHPSLIDVSPASNRRHSRTSINSPTSPNHRHSFARSDSIGGDVFNSGSAPANGLGNLADELADDWDDEEEEEDEELDMNFQEEEGKVEGGEPTRDSGVDIDSSPRKVENLALPSNGVNGHRRVRSEYDGSDYGEESDLDSPGILPPGLVARMDLVESLARRGTEESGSERDGVVKRVIEGLKDLGGQSTVEGGASRLITAHSALSTHLHHQTRTLQSLAYPLFSPGTLPPDEETIDDLLPLLATLSESMPRPTTAAMNSLTQLHSLTAELISTINYLSDTLHMSRQTTTMANRRLKSAKELVAEMRKEEEEREEGERWLTKGNWGERLSNRECATVCGDVVGGFEEVCNSWRERLLAQEGGVGIAL